MGRTNNGGRELQIPESEYIKRPGVTDIVLAIMEFADNNPKKYETYERKDI